MPLRAEKYFLSVFYSFFLFFSIFLSGLRVWRFQTPEIMENLKTTPRKYIFWNKNINMFLMKRTISTEKVPAIRRCPNCFLLFPSATEELRFKLGKTECFSSACELCTLKTIFFPVYGRTPANWIKSKFVH